MERIARHRQVDLLHPYAHGAFGNLHRHRVVLPVVLERPLTDGKASSDTSSGTPENTRTHARYGIDPSQQPILTFYTIDKTCAFLSSNPF